MHIEPNFIAISAKIQFNDLDSLDTCPNAVTEVTSSTQILSGQWIKISVTFFTESMQIMYSVDR